MFEKFLLSSRVLVSLHYKATQITVLFLLCCVLDIHVGVKQSEDPYSLLELGLHDLSGIVNRTAPPCNVYEECSDSESEAGNARTSPFTMLEQHC